MRIPGRYLPFGRKCHTKHSQIYSEAKFPGTKIHDIRVSSCEVYILIKTYVITFYNQSNTAFYAKKRNRSAYIEKCSSRSTFKSNPLLTIKSCSTDHS